MNPTDRTVVFVFEPRRWVAYAVVLAVSVGGTLTSVWVFGVAVGHPYHLVGLVVGGSTGDYSLGPGGRRSGRPYSTRSQR